MVSPIGDILIIEDVGASHLDSLARQKRDTLVENA